MHINFLFSNQKLSINYKGTLREALEFLEFEYGRARIHSVHPTKGPIVVFKGLPRVSQVKNWAIKRVDSK
jgi:hypothetical protein